jgi:NADP-dependent 3-hydroxy acid dehydrogenase YdfG
LPKKAITTFFQTRFTLSGPERPLDQQVIVITGGSSAIGLCTAQLAAQRTASLVVVARGGELLRRLAGDISAQGGRTIIAGADVAVRAKLDCEALLAVGHYGRVDTRVNDAAFPSTRRLDEVSEADNRRLFDINSWKRGERMPLRAALPQAGGRHAGERGQRSVAPGGFAAGHALASEQRGRASPMWCRGGSDVRVGGVPVMNKMLSKVLPSVADRTSAKQVERQQSNRAQARSRRRA